VIDQFTINGLYGAYEPAFSMSAVHNYDAIPGGVFAEDGTPYGSSIEKIDSYTPGLRECWPTGDL